MSLINQMLKDLDKRNASVEGVQPMSGEVRSVAGSSNTAVSPVVLVVLLVAVAVGGALLWQKYRKPEPKLEIAPPAVVAVAPPVAPKAEPAPPPAAETPAPVAAPAPAAPAPVAAEKEAIKPLPPVAVKETAPAKSVTVIARNEKSAESMPPAQPAKAVTQDETPAPVVQKPEKPVKTAREGKSAPMKIVSAQQRSDNAYRQAVSLLQKGRSVEARDSLVQALVDNPLNHPARQMLAVLLVENAQQAEAVNVLQEGLKFAPGQTRFSLMLARLQAEAGDDAAALGTLEAGLPMAGNDGEFHGLMATLLQREGRHDEAVEHYLTALRTDPAMPNWLVGIGISLQAVGKSADAIEAYSRALQTDMLTPEMTQFVDQRLKQLQGK